MRPDPVTLKWRRLWQLQVPKTLTHHIIVVRVNLSSIHINPGCWFFATPLKNHGVSSSVGMMTFHSQHNGKNKIQSCSSHQPESIFQYYPLVNIQKAIENGPVEIVDFPINSMVDLSIAFCMFTRGYIPISVLPSSVTYFMAIPWEIPPLASPTPFAICRSCAWQSSGLHSSAPWEPWSSLPGGAKCGSFDGEIKGFHEDFIGTSWDFMGF